MKGTFFAIGLAVAFGRPAVDPAPAPNFSGNWALASATASGRGRSTSGGDAPQTGGERPTSSHTTSGAAFNCGRGCTIIHEGQTLKVEKALLASAISPAPTVAFQLDGRQMSVINSISGSGELPTTATWNGDTVDIVTKPERLPVGFKQTLVLDGAQLVVVTEDDKRMSRVTLKYSRK